jgi:SAM-dependent methyltransferase
MKKVKLHLGCGTVYLKGYINVDAPETAFRGTRFAIRRAIKRNSTTLANYYKRRFNKIKGGSELPRVADMYFDIRNLPDYFAYESVDEILAYQVIEHFKQHEFETVMKNWHNCLKKGGILRIDVPDILATLRVIIDSENDVDKDFVLRLIYGSGRNNYCIHYNGFYPSKLTKILKNIGYRKIVPFVKNIHSYPSFGLVCTK